MACPGIFSFTDSVFDRNITIFLERVSPNPVLGGIGRIL
jgi:hypothetical protein